MASARLVLACPVEFVLGTARSIHEPAAPPLFDSFSPTSLLSAAVVDAGDDRAARPGRQPRDLPAAEVQSLAPVRAGAAAEVDAAIACDRRIDGGVKDALVAGIGGKGRHGDGAATRPQGHGREAGAGIDAAKQAAGGARIPGLGGGGENG